MKGVIGFRAAVREERREKRREEAKMKMKMNLFILNRRNQPRETERETEREGAYRNRGAVEQNREKELPSLSSLPLSLSNSSSYCFSL